MNIIDIKEKLDRIDQLISLKATGTPKELARKFNTNERTIYRIIKQLKEMGCPIYFDKIRGSYCYKQQGKLLFKFKPKIADIKVIEDIEKWGGGKIPLGYFYTDNICQYYNLLS